VVLTSEPRLLIKNTANEANRRQRTTISKVAVVGFPIVELGWGSSTGAIDRLIDRSSFGFNNHHTYQLEPVRWATQTATDNFVTASSPNAQSAV
jgi:hypothetical protein